MTTQEQTHAASEESRDAELWRGQPPAGASTRERLLAGMPVTERRLQLMGVSTAVLEGGNGPPLILLHGPGGYAAHWMRVIPGLASAYCSGFRRLTGVGAAVSNVEPGDVALYWIVPTSLGGENRGRATAGAVWTSPLSGSWDSVVAQAICVAR